MKYKPYKNYSNIFVFDSNNPGPTITIFGGIHGDEIAGIEVIDKLIKDLEQEKIKLKQGKLILAYGNEVGIKIKKRGDKHNLNRLFKDKYLNKKTFDPEIKRAQELANILDHSDVLLDIHSVSSSSVPFIFSEDIKNELEIAQKIGPKKCIVGWLEISGELISGDTDSYMHKLGKTAFTLECGNHNSKNAFGVGYQTSLKLLEYFNLLEEKQSLENKDTLDLIKMYKIKTTQTGTFVFRDGIDNFSQMKKGEFIGYDFAEEIYAEEDFIILLPTYNNLKPGEEVFYYGKKLT